MTDFSIISVNYLEYARKADLQADALETSDVSGTPVDRLVLIKSLRAFANDLRREATELILKSAP